jgi:hypothetical protein
MVTGWWAEKLRKLQKDFPLNEKGVSFALPYS